MTKLSITKTKRLKLLFAEEIADLGYYLNEKATTNYLMLSTDFPGQKMICSYYG